MLQALCKSLILMCKVRVFLSISPTGPNLVNAAQAKPRNNHNPSKNMHAVPSAFSPANRRIFTLNVGSSSKGRDLDQDIPSSQAGDLTTYLQGVIEGILTSPAKPYPIYLPVIHFVRKRQSPFPSSTILEVRTDTIPLGYGIYKYFLQKRKSCNLK